MTLDSGTAARLDDAQSRLILDDEGREWIVSEFGPARYDRRATGSLVFWSGHAVMRRVPVFPHNWRELSDAELYALTLRP